MRAEGLIGREDESAFLVDAALHGRLVGLVAPRRFGKTSLLGRVVADLRTAHDMAAALVDLHGAVSIADVALRLERAYSRHLTGTVRRHVERILRAAGLGLSLGAAGFSVTIQQRPATDPLPALHALLDVPERLDRRVYVVLDEFQSLLGVPNADAIVRSHIQHHLDTASYAFAGSEPGLMEQAFNDQHRAFFTQVDLRRLGRLGDAALGDAIEERFAATGRTAGDMLGVLLRTAEGHPQRAMLLAHQLWNATPGGSAADEGAWEQALDHALTAVRRESEARYDAKARNEQRVLRAVAVFNSPYAAAARVSLGLPRGSASHATERLLAEGDIERADDGGYRVVDPLFGLWLRSLHRGEPE